MKNAFKYRNEKRCYEYIVVTYISTYLNFVKNTSNANNKYTEYDLIRMLDVFIDNICDECGGVIFLKVIETPMGTNCAHLLVDRFVYSYEAEFTQTLIKIDIRF